MKRIFAWLLAASLACAAVVAAQAQGAESIWLEAPASAYQAGDTLLVTVNGRSATPIQGFTFQIRYDPACLKPVDAASPIAAMNGLKLPQQTGLADASFASTVPQKVDGVLAEVHFLALASCQTQLVLEGAALAIRNSSGFAAALPGVTTDQKPIALTINPGSVVPQPTPPLVGTPLPLGMEPVKSPNLLLWGGITALIMLVVGFGLFALLRWSRAGASTPGRKRDVR